MTSREFLTVPDELLEVAEAIATDFEERGFKVLVEHSDLSYPFTPALVCKRKSTTVIIEVDKAVVMARLQEWGRYCGSCSRDTEVALALPADVVIPPAQEDRLRNLGIGIYRTSASGVTEVAPPRDLALQLKLPERRNLHPKLRKLLGSAYDQFNRAQWREGFEEACQALEEEARRYLKREVKAGRAVILDARGRPKTLTDKAIDKMTMGQLKDTFLAIRNLTRADSLIAEGLTRINKDRVRVAHHKAKGSAEAALRKNVGQHMWSIVSILRAILGIKS